MGVVRAFRDAKSSCLDQSLERMNPTRGTARDPLVRKGCKQQLWREGKIRGRKEAGISVPRLDQGCFEKKKKKTGMLLEAMETKLQINAH